MGTKNSWTRRETLKTLGLASTASLLSLDALSMAFEENLKKQSTLSLEKPVTAVVIGAGNRGNTYGNYALEHVNELDIVGVAEPITIRNERFSKKHDIKKKDRFVTWEHVFEQPKFADAVIISTPDKLHYGPCMKALEMGYDILLEKPISPSEQECRDILKLAKKTGRIVGVCHVLRYAPYFEQLKHIVDSKLIGDLISVQHLEPIGYEHMAHSYVRGPWHNSKESTPIILGKSCHDLDILRWLIGDSCEKIVAFGDQKWFINKNAPKGSTPRCTDGCAIESECPYSALKLYYKWVFKEQLQTVSVYHKFINWVSGEFDLYLQEDTSGLKVYYPNGWLYINIINQFETTIGLEVIVVSKSKKSVRPSKSSITVYL